MVPDEENSTVSAANGAEDGVLGGEENRAAGSSMSA